MANNDQEERLLGRLAEIVNKSMESIKNDLKEELSTSRKRHLHEEVDDKIKKRIKESEVPTFKRKFNKEQFEYNAKVKQVFVDVENLLEEDNVEKAKEKVKEGMSILQKREKLISIADREDDDWEVIFCLRHN